MNIDLLHCLNCKNGYYYLIFYNILRVDIAIALSFMVKKYFDGLPKARELLKMIEPEVMNSRLRDVVEFEVDYIRRSLEQEQAEKLAERDRVISERNKSISERNKTISERNMTISEKDKEIRMLKAKLEENGIEY